MEKSLDEIIAGKTQEKRREGRGRPKGRRQPRRGGPIKSGRGDTRGHAVIITNVHNDISEDDLRDLFRQAGPVVSVTKQAGGRRQKGSVAWVLFEFSADAAVAVGRFNNRSAAGQVINVRQVERVGDLTVTNSLADRLGGSTSERKTKNGRKGRRGGEKTNKSAEELDAELEDYMAVDTEPQAPATGNAQSSEQAQPAPASAAEEPPAPMDELMIE